MSKHYDSIIYLECDCTQISEHRWSMYMKGAVKANGKKIRMMIKKQLPDLYRKLALDYPNPYEFCCRRTQPHLIYMHSSIEYFLRKTS